jgi:hypothetical protein
MTIFDLFLFFIILIIFTVHLIAWIISLFCETRNNYTNPYRLIPREEADSYKRYERREYQDSLKNRKKYK